MTVTHEETDIDWDLLFDFDPEVTCVGVGGKECPNKAEWRMIFSCCDEVLLICTAHKKSGEEYINKKRSMGMNLLHTKCGANDPKIVFEPIA